MHRIRDDFNNVDDHKVPGGWGTPIFGLYGYVPLNRVWFLRTWVLNRVYISLLSVFLDWKPFKECEDLRVLMHQMFLYLQGRTKCLMSKKPCVCNTKRTSVCFPSSRGFFLVWNLAFTKSLVSLGSDVVFLSPERASWGGPLRTRLTSK